MTIRKHNFSKGTNPKNNDDEILIPVEDDSGNDAEEDMN